MVKSSLKRKTKKQSGGGMRFWQQLLMGRFFGVGGPSKSRSRSRSRSRSKSRSRSRSRSRSNSSYKNRLLSKPKVTSRVDKLVNDHKKLILNPKQVNKLTKTEYNEFVRRITK